MHILIRYIFYLIFCNVTVSGRFDWRFPCFLNYQKDFFDLDLFKQARRNIGPLRAEESYIFEPIPALGGAKESLYLSNTGKTWEYLNYVISMC